MDKSTFDDETRKCHRIAADGLKGLHRQQQWVDRSLLQVRTMQHRLLKRLEVFQRNAALADDTEDGKNLQRKYLKTRADLARCEQGLQMLRKMQLEIKSMFGTNGTNFEKGISVSSKSQPHQYETIGGKRKRTIGKQGGGSSVRPITDWNTERTPGTVLVSRFSGNIDKDIKRGWSAYQHYSLGGRKSEVMQEAREWGIPKSDLDDVVVKHPEGGWAIKHHDGLSVYPLESETVDDAHHEAVNGGYQDGSGWAHQTIGEIRKMRTIPKEHIGTSEDLHILEVPDTEPEKE